MEIEVRIRALMIDPDQNIPIVILKSVDDERVLPIWIGAPEANAIAMEIEKIVPARPMTHDLLRNLIELIGGHVRRVVITELNDNSYHAVIEMIDREGSNMIFDSRPSDSIALALRVDCPIFVNEILFGEYENRRLERDQEESAEADEWPEVIESPNDLSM